MLTLEEWVDQGYKAVESLRAERKSALLEIAELKDKIDVVNANVERLDAEILKMAKAIESVSSTVRKPIEVVEHTLLERLRIAGEDGVFPTSSEEHDELEAMVEAGDVVVAILGDGSTPYYRLSNLDGIDETTITVTGKPLFGDAGPKHGRTGG